MKRPKRYILDDPAEIPRTLFPSVCCLFAVVALAIAYGFAESRNWFRQAAEVFFPSLSVPETRYAAEDDPVFLEKKRSLQWRHSIEMERYFQDGSINRRLGLPAPSMPDFQSIRILPDTPEEAAQRDAARTQESKARRLEKIFTWTAIGVIAGLLVTGYVWNLKAYRKLKERCLTEGMAFLALMWANMVFVGLLVIFFMVLDHNSGPSVGGETMVSYRGREVSASGFAISVCIGILLLAGGWAATYYKDVTTLREDRIALRWPKAWSLKLTGVSLLPALALLLVFVR